MALSPTSSEGGGTFNGGTITTPLVVDDATANSVALRVDSANVAGDGQDTFVVRDSTGTEVFVIDSDGDTLVATDDAFGQFQVKIAGAARLNVQSGSVLVSLGGSRRVTFNVGGAVVYAGFTAAPADGDLNASEFALWLDDTAGVGNTKLMVKAKDSAGTVRAAAIVLA